MSTYANKKFLYFFKLPIDECFVLVYDNVNQNKTFLGGDQNE